MKANFITWFLRRFSAFRSMEKTTESDAALIESLNRYIEAREGRDEERVNRITELEETCRENLETIKELREQLFGILPRKG